MGLLRCHHDDGDVLLRRLLTSVAVGATALGTIGVVTSTGVSTVAADAPGPQTPAANPPMVESCGADVVLVLDASGSISSSDAVDDVRDAADAFLDALADTGSTARVTQFASLSEELAPQAEVTAASMQTGGLFRNAINDYYDPIPPRPNDVNLYQYDGRGDPQSSGNFRLSNGSNQYTNWDQSLEQAAQVQPKPIELVVYVTDGDPTAFDFNQPGDPFSAGPPPDVAISTTGDASQTTLDRAVQEANRIKNSRSRMLAVGVGSAVTGNPSSRARLVQIAGPQVVTDAGLGSITSINQVDVALVQDFERLANFLRGVVNELCTPSLTVRKLAQTADSADYAPAADWSITAAPTVAGGGTYRWILPDTDPAQRARCGNPTNPNDQATRTCLTDATGLASFQWEPSPSDRDTSVVITEALRPGYTAGRPLDTDWRCVLKNNDGSHDEQSGNFGTPPLGFTLLVDPKQIITCVIYNSFDYAPAITLAKQNNPTQVRGDLSPPANAVVSTFTVTNPGNTPLNHIKLIDDKCTPTFVSGDTNNDGRLAAALAETWTFRCTRNLVASSGSPPLLVTNNAKVTGVDPNGRTVTALATANATAYAPAITLTKTATPTQIQVGVPTPVTYNYLATNTGNMTLTNVAVTDNLRTASCTPVTPLSIPSLAPGASAPFTCTTILTAAAADATFANTAQVVGNPIFPDATAAPPVVTAEATAVVTAFQTGIDLVKTVNHTVVLPGTLVEYTYTVTNTGTVNLVRPPPPGSPNPRDGWVDDTAGPTGTCAPVTYVSGDVGAPNVLEVGETWTYTCGTVIDGSEPSVLNTATVVAEVQGNPALTVTDSDDATVDVVQPEIVLEKSTIRPVVLDATPVVGGGPDPFAGPDVPVRTPAAYLYTVHNTGNTSVRNVVVTDEFPVPATSLCPVTPVLQVGTNAGDVNANSAIDPGESWQYQCVLDGLNLLTKEDSDDPPGSQPLVPSTVTNTASATAEAFFLDGATEVTGLVASNSATAQVQVIAPSLAMTKEPCIDDGTGTLTCSNNLLVRPGTDVTFRYVVNNTGDSDLHPNAGSDDSCGNVTYIGGDANTNGLLDAGLDREAWEYRCTAEINRPSPAVNNAAIAATDPLGNRYLATATATVRIFEPAINLTKTVSDNLVPAGSTVTYTFRVTNAGTVLDDGLPAEVVLSNIGLLDISRPANPSCTTPGFVGGDGNGNGLLDLIPAETWIYQCTGVINVRTVNAAGVSGRDIQNGQVVDFDAATVTPFVTGINITKTANPTQLPAGGGLVTYDYQVTNTGNVPLSNIDGRVVDDKCPNVVGVNLDGFNFGDFDQNGVLTGEGDLFETGGPEVWLFTCTMNIAVTTVNTVSVVGTPVQPVPDVPTQQSSLRSEAFVVLAPDVTSSAVAQVVILDSGVVPPTTTAPPEVAPVAPLPRTGMQNGMNILLIALGVIAIGIALRMPSRRRSR